MDGSDALAAPGTGVEVAANVSDLLPYYRAAHVLAVPLQSGGGTRLKILEAFAAGVPVVSTPVGCEGIDAINGSHLAIAERDDFVPAILRLLKTPHLSSTLAHRARTLARQQYDWSVVGALACDALARAAVPAPTPPALWPQPAIGARVRMS